MMTQYTRNQGPNHDFSWIGTVISVIGVLVLISNVGNSTKNSVSISKANATTRETVKNIAAEQRNTINSPQERRPAARSDIDKKIFGNLQYEPIPREYNELRLLRETALYSNGPVGDITMDFAGLMNGIDSMQKHHTLAASETELIDLFRIEKKSEKLYEGKLLIQPYENIERFSHLNIEIPEVAFLTQDRWQHKNILWDYYRIKNEKSRNRYLEKIIDVNNELIIPVQQLSDSIQINEAAFYSSELSDTGINNSDILDSLKIQDAIPKFPIINLQRNTGNITPGKLVS
jgi:hypothetical protein